MAVENDDVGRCIRCPGGYGIAYSKVLEVLAVGASGEEDDFVQLFERRPRVGFVPVKDFLTIDGEEIFELKFSEGPHLTPLLLVAENQHVRAVDVVAVRDAGSVMSPSAHCPYVTGMDARGALVAISNGYNAVLMVKRVERDGLFPNWVVERLIGPGVYWPDFNRLLVEPAAVRFSADGRELAVVDSNKTRTRIFLSATGTYLKTLGRKNRIEDVAEDENGQWLQSESMQMETLPGLGLLGRCIWLSDTMRFLVSKDDVLQWSMSKIRFAFLCAWWRASLSGLKSRVVGDQKKRRRRARK